LQKVATISSIHIRLLFGRIVLFIWPPAPSACCRCCCAATGDAAKSRATVNASILITGSLRCMTPVPPTYTPNDIENQAATHLAQLPPTSSRATRRGRVAAKHRQAAGIAMEVISPADHSNVAGNLILLNRNLLARPFKLSITGDNLHDCDHPRFLRR
jgi:hypothetical protein